VGQVDPLAPNTHQIHDFNPGVNPYPQGLFWTVTVPDASVQVDLTTGTASFRISDMAIMDFTTLANALAGHPGVPATVSFDMEWSGVLSKYPVNDPTNGFAGAFMQTGGTIVWSAKTATGSFQSDPAATSKPVYAQLGQEVSGTSPVVLSATPYYGSGRRYRSGPR
jgi:hypothetical protein